ncbi:drug:h+ antiporter [Pholiota molesta]|nr:drug:h+ antiporter [Pholiota molesta]
MSSHKSDNSIRDSEKGVPGDASAESVDTVAHLGVKTVEATHKVYGKYSKWFLFIGLGLAAYIYSLDGTTTYSYLAFATSSFGDHSLISTIQVAQSIIIACGKPVIAKIADVGSRGTAYVAVLIFYVIGYIVIASAKHVGTVAGGIILYAIGYTGLQLLTQIIIADMTTLKWRGLVSSLMSLPFIINAFVGSNISANVITGAGWRWGYGMFAILIPVSLMPLIITLVWAELKAKKLVVRAWSTFEKLDVMGLLLIGTSVALILLPLTLSEKAKGGWNNASMIAMIVIGCVLVPFSAIYEFKLAKYPVLAPRFALNRSVVVACAIGAFDFQTQTVALTIFGIAAGSPCWCGLMIHSRGANASTPRSCGVSCFRIGGVHRRAQQVSAQASVPHADVAMVTAVVLLLTEIGGAIGSAIAGSIWTHLMPGRLARYLPALSADQRAQLFGSITAAAAYREVTPFARVSFTVNPYIAATVFAVVPFLLAFLMPDWYLGDQQNAVENIDLAGEKVENPDAHT